MIAPVGFSGGGDGHALHGPLAVAAQETLTTFAAVTDVMSAVGQMIMVYGVGQPLAAFQSLLRTYQTLVKAEASLANTAQQILKAVAATPKSQGHG